MGNRFIDLPTLMRLPQLIKLHESVGLSTSSQQLMYSTASAEWIKLHCMKLLATSSRMAYLSAHNCLYHCRKHIPPCRHVSLRVPDYRQHIPLHLAGYRFTLQDYLSYERQCAAILNQPHGRTALLMGGIVWRRARDILSFDGVLTGPSSSVRDFGKGSCLQSLGEQDHTCYWDDALDQEELDIICGLYHCETGLIILSSHMQSPTNSIYCR